MNFLCEPDYFILGIENYNFVETFEDFGFVGTCLPTGEWDGLPKCEIIFK